MTDGEFCEKLVNEYRCKLEQGKLLNENEIRNLCGIYWFAEMIENKKLQEKIEEVERLYLKKIEGLVPTERVEVEIGEFKEICEDISVRRKEDGTFVLYMD